MERLNGGMRLKKYVRLLRVKHWIKNGLIFLPLIGAYNFLPESILKVAIAFFAFSFLASFVYIMNDIVDVQKDRKHPRKKNRPIASGEISLTKATFIAIFLIVCSIFLNYIAMGSFFNAALGILLLYLLNNICYSFGMKNIPILDVSLLTAGFVLRVYYGSFVVGIPVSSWLFLTVLSASLYMGFGKRRKEFGNTEEVRPVLKYYNKRFVENFMNISLTLVVVFYSFWAMEQGNALFYASIPMLIIIFMQYMLFVEIGNEGDPVTLLFQHKSLMITVIIYAVYMMAVMLYLSSKMQII